MGRPAHLHVLPQHREDILLALKDAVGEARSFTLTASRGHSPRSAKNSAEADAPKYMSVLLLWKVSSPAASAYTFLKYSERLEAGQAGRSGCGECSRHACAHATRAQSVTLPGMSYESRCSTQPAVLGARAAAASRSAAHTWRAALQLPFKSGTCHTSRTSCNPSQQPVSMTLEEAQVEQCGARFGPATHPTPWMEYPTRVGPQPRTSPAMPPSFTVTLKPVLMFLYLAWSICATPG